MSARRMLIGRLFVLGCALVLMAFAAQRAQADPKPVAPPQTHSGSTGVQPDPAPGASGTSSTTSTQISSSTSTQLGSSTSTHLSPPVSSSISTVSRPTASARVRALSRPLHAMAQGHPAHREAARHQPPSLNSGWPDWLRNAAALNGLRAVETSGSSSLLVAAGIALVLLVLAEASFLGLAGSRVGRAEAQAPAGKRPAEEPLAIRRVQLRR